MTDSHQPGAQRFTDPDPVIDLAALIGVLWRRKVAIAAVTLAFLAVGALYAFLVAVPKYRATSVVLLETQGPEIVDLGMVLPSFGADSEGINTEVEVIRSRRLLERVVEAENLTGDPEFNGRLAAPGPVQAFRARITGAGPGNASPEGDMTRAIDSLLGRVSVTKVPNTYVLRITVETESPAKSARLADAVAEQYVVYQMDVKFEATREASNWLGTRVADLKLELEAAEAQLTAFSTSAEVISPESVQALEVQLKELRDRLKVTQGSEQAARERVATLETLRAGNASEIVARAGDTRLASIYRSSGAGEAFDRRFEETLHAAAQQAAQLGQQAATVRARITVLESEVARQSAELIQLQQLRRETEANRLLYEYFLSRLKESSAREGIQQPDSRILSNAVLPTAPSEPRKSLILVVFAMLGLMSGSAGALYRETRHQSYRDAGQLEAETGVRIMGQVPLLPVSARHSVVDHLAEKPTSAGAEAIRNLRTSLLLSREGAAPQVVMVSSSLPGEGKTTLSFALAQNLTGLGKKVLLVEGDMRRRVFREYIEPGTGPGLMDVVAGRAPLGEALIHDATTGADILVSEASRDNAADVLSSPGFEALLSAARESHDFVIVDTPPVLVVPDARIVAQHADAVLFTVRWDRTTRRQVHDALAMFASVGHPVDGIVLNQIDPKGMKRYGYGEDYGVYAAYGSRYYTD